MSEKKEKPTDIPVTQRETEKDAFDTLADICINAVDEMTRMQIQYTQTFTNIQQEFIDTVKRMTSAYADISKTVAHTTYGPMKMPAIFTKSINDNVDFITRVSNISNKAVISSLELARQNLKVFNDNIDSFTKLNINFIKTWSSIMTPQRS